MVRTVRDVGIVKVGLRCLGFRGGLGFKLSKPRWTGNMKA